MRRLSLVLALFLSILTAASDVSAQQNWGQGPIRLDEQFPLTALHLSFAPESPEVEPAGHTAAEAHFAWTNTTNRRRRSYRVDAETRELLLGVSHSLTSTLALRAELPVRWRGAGVLDSPIYEWHQFFGLPQGPRDDFPADEYAITFRDEDGETHSLKDGSGLGSPRLTGKLLLSEGDEDAPAVTLIGTVEAPTISSDFGHQGLDVLAGVLLGKRYGSWLVYGGAAYQFIGDRDTLGMEFRRHRGSGYLAAEYQFTPALSALFGLSGATEAIKSIPMFPDYSTYLDVGLRWQAHEQVDLQLLVRENPAPDQGTADFTMLAALKAEF